MDGYGCNDEGNGRFSPWDLQTDCGYDGEEGKCQGIGVGFGGSGSGGGRDTADEGVCEEASGKNCGLHSGSDYLRAVYMRG